MKKLLFSLLILTTLFGVWGVGVPTTEAASIVPCGNQSTLANGGFVSDECTICHLQVLAIRFVHTVILIAVAITAVLFANAGYLYIMSSANPGNVSKGHRLFSTALTGFLIVLCAWLITELIMSTFIDKNSISDWRNILCETKYNQETTETAINAVVVAAGPGYDEKTDFVPSTTNPKGQVLSTAALTQGIQRLENNCTTASGQTCADYIRQQAIAKGIDPNFALAVAAVESGGKANPAAAVSPAGAYGVMQLKPETAKEMCGAPCAGMTNQQMMDTLLNDPAKNIDYGLKYIQKADSYVQSIQGSSQIDPARTNDYIVAYYNGGQGSLAPSNDCGATQTKYECTINAGGYTETQKYVAKMNTFVNSVNSATQIASGG